MEAGPFKEGDGKLINDVPENSFSVENIKSSWDPNGKEETIHLEEWLMVSDGGFWGANQAKEKMPNLVSHRLKPQKMPVPTMEQREAP